MKRFIKNITVVFIGSFLASFLNLLYQLFLAHQFSPSDFSAFNSLLSVFTIISVPLIAIQTAVAKYSAEFNAHGSVNKIRSLLSVFLKRSIFIAILSFAGFYYFSLYVINKLNINSPASAYLLSLLIATSWILPVLMGSAQGLELFGWFISASLLNSIIKLVLCIIFVMLGFSISGALGAFFVANLAAIAILSFALRNYFCFGVNEEEIDYKEIIGYLFPIALSLFCFMALVNMDMIFARYFFPPHESGFYSLAQVVGKIFLFLPTAISIALLPRASGSKAKNINTESFLRYSLLCGAALCLTAVLIYNLFPAFILRALTGKVFPESIALARLFSISMSIYAMVNIFITYFLSLGDLRFIKYLVLFTLLQAVIIMLLHPSLMYVQFILCISSVVLLFIHITLAYRKPAYSV